MTKPTETGQERCESCGSDDPAVDVADNGGHIRREELRVRMLKHLLCPDPFHKPASRLDYPDE